MMEKKSVSYRECIRFVIEQMKSINGIRDFAFFTHEQTHIETITDFFSRLAMKSSFFESIEYGEGISLKLNFYNGDVAYISFHLISHQRELDTITINNVSRSFAWVDIRKTTKSNDLVILFVSENKNEQSTL